MKFAVVAVLALAAVAQGFVLPLYKDGNLHENIIDNVIIQVLEYVRTLLKKNEPYTLPDIPELAIVDTDVNLNVKVSHLQLSQADDFVIETIDNSLGSLSANFRLKAPKPHIETNFTISGDAFSKTVTGTGQISIDVTDLDFSGYGQIEFVNHGLQLANLMLNITLDGAQFAVSGLSVDGMTEEQITEYLNNDLLPTLQAHQAEVNEKVASQIMSHVNEILAGKTIAQLIDWLVHNKLN